MSPSAEPLFPPRGERAYDAAAIETFPWPVTAGYDDVHRWMDQDQAVHAAWQLRDVWEGLLKFLSTLAVADHLTCTPADDPRTRKLFDQLLKANGLTNGSWATLMEVALKDGPPPGARLRQLGPLLFQGGKRQRLFRLFMGDKADLIHDDFIEWRNRCFGHGVFRKDLRSYAQEALHWLGRLHEAFELCRPVFTSLMLESDGPKGEILTWGEKSPLPFYHGHQPAPGGPVLAPVRVRTSGNEALLLTPLLSVQLCVVCGQWTAFYLDKYDRDKHRAQFLDFIEGHSNDQKDLEPLRTWSARIGGPKAPAVAAPQAEPDEPREPDPERFRDFQHEFEPPVYLARQVADFLRTHDRGVLLFTGPGGVGKSWATQGLDHAGMLPTELGRAVPLLDVSMHGPIAPRASDVRTELAERARRTKRWQVPAWPDGPEPHTRFSAWLAALMRANGLGELVVAMDGLDDLPADSDVPDLWPPADKLPPGCYLVLSTRPAVRLAADSGLRRVRSMPDYFCELRVGPDEPEHRAVLRSYVTKRLARLRPDGEGPLPAAWADPLIDQAGGSFLYVFHYCRALHFGVYADLAHLPPPSRYYPAFFAHLRGRVGDELFHHHYAWALALLAVAREPVGLTHLEAWGLKRSDLVVILDDLADLLRTRREPWDAETLYSLGHDAIRQFLTEDADWQSRLAGANRHLAKLAVRRFGKDWSAVDPFDRVERYLLVHLLDHATEPELRGRLLADTSLADACVKHGEALWRIAAFAPCLAAHDMAVSLREYQVWDQGRLELKDALATAYMNRAAYLGILGYPEKSLEDMNAAIRLEEDLLHGKGRVESREALAGAYMNRGEALSNLGRFERALADYNLGIQIWEELARAEDIVVHRNLAIAYKVKANALCNLWHLDESLALYNVAIGLCEELVRRDLAQAFPEEIPEVREAMQASHELREDLASAYQGRGAALGKLGRLDEALSDFKTAVNMLEKLVRDEGHLELRASLASAILDRGITFSRLGRSEKALDDYNTAIRMREELVNRGGRDDLRQSLAFSYMIRGTKLPKLGRPEDALADFTTAISMYEDLIHKQGRDHLRDDLALTYRNRGTAFANRNRAKEALADYFTAIGVYEDLVHRQGRRELVGDLAWAYAGHADMLLQLDQREEACERACKAVALLKSELTRTGREQLSGVLELAEAVARNACG